MGDPPQPDPFREAFDPPLRIVGRAGARIASIDDWREHAAPTGGASQWVEGRSAFECARDVIQFRSEASPLTDFEVAPVLVEEEGAWVYSELGFAEPRRLFLTISLSEPFNGRHYKL